MTKKVDIKKKVGTANRTGIPNGPNAKKPGPVVRKMDWERIGNMASIQCTITEIAAIEGIGHDWLAILCERDNGVKLGEFIEQHRRRGHESLRRAQWVNAIDKGNVQMQIFLGKNWLEQSEKVEHYAKPEPIIIQRLNGDQLELGSEFKENDI